MRSITYVAACFGLLICTEENTFSIDRIEQGSSACLLRFYDGTESVIVDYDSRTVPEVVYGTHTVQSIGDTLSEVCFTPDFCLRGPDGTTTQVPLTNLGIAGLLAASRYAQGNTEVYSILDAYQIISVNRDSIFCLKHYINLRVVDSRGNGSLWTCGPYKKFIEIIMTVTDMNQIGAVEDLWTRHWSKRQMHGLISRMHFCGHTLTFIDTQLDVTNYRKLFKCLIDALDVGWLETSKLDLETIAQNLLATYTKQHMIKYLNRYGFKTALDHESGIDKSAGLS